MRFSVVNLITYIIPYKENSLANHRTAHKNSVTSRESSLQLDILHKIYKINKIRDEVGLENPLVPTGLVGSPAQPHHS